MASPNLLVHALLLSERPVHPQLRLIGHLLLLVFIACCGQSCVRLQQPTFKSIAVPDQVNVQGSKVTMNSEVTLHNPNDRRLQLKEMNIGVFSGGERLGQVVQDLEIPVEAQSDFSIPFQLSFDWMESQKGLLNAAITAFQDRKIKLHFRGYVKVSAKNKRGFKIPVIYTEKLKLE